MPDTTNEPTKTELEICLKVLRQAANDPAAFDESLEFKTLVAKINRTARKHLRQQSLLTRQEHDSNVKQGILEARAQTGLQPESQVTRGLRLSRPRRCYVCKNLYQDCHAFYHLMCAECGKFNHRKREQRCDLNGRVALLTGGRIKIGFELALKLLRDDARVIVTTRFPNDAFQRFAAQADAHEWQHRLSLHGLDLRHIPSVQAFIDDLKLREPHLDILINNAAQTISRPPAFYQHLFEAEHLALPNAQDTVQSSMQFFAQAALELPAASQYFPAGVFDQDGQQLDARPVNSWLQKLAEVGTRDLLEVQLVNAIAPFMLCSQLKPLLLRSPNPRRFIINVSAMEGQFNRTAKGVYHPHTNMAKAALNMLTRTSAADCAKDQIFMNSVDTGWVTDENPLPKAQRLREQGFFTPLDHIDGAARIYDPIARGMNETETPVFGAFLKDYAPHPW